ncbi:ERG4/ERG24 ergosterol biosynthesis protein [Mrakia frigida]|uniref:ERG4/ERG24 ergosterol biosynthesis protein n=1 Tax=Mrakia frigida TaxID=29902 RepID=UPI003FCBFCEA
MANDGPRERKPQKVVPSKAASTSNEKKKGSEVTFVPTPEARLKDLAADTHSHWEFGGPVGVTAMMTGFPCLMFYLWTCLWFYQGRFIRPESIEDIRPFLNRIGNHIYEDAYPTAFAFKMYLGLMAFQLIIAFLMPGKIQKGLPVPSLDYKTLTYRCNALYCCYFTLVVSSTLHLTGLFDLTQIIDHFGELMSVSMIVGFALSFLVYFGAIFFHWGGKPIRMSGWPVYDFFMGASLNPQIFNIDLKMWQEVRIPWVLLFHIAISAALKQYQTIGYVTPNLAFMVLATGLYLNACAKGEECIPQTIDMFYEKDGFMLTFWNFAGVPFTYSYSIVYLHRTDPSAYKLSTAAMTGVYCLLLLSYYIFDTAMSQKSNFRMELQNEFVPRDAFPQLPWRRVKNPKYIETKHGNKLLISGWWGFLRKPNYTADLIQSFTWGLCTGWSSPIAYYYVVWFTIVLMQRCSRDFAKCRAKYGEDWDRYCKAVPYTFIPGLF